MCDDCRFQRAQVAANVTVDWIGYQGAPVGGLTGEVRVSQWWTGTTCETVNFPSVSDLNLFFGYPMTKVKLSRT